MQLFTLNIWTFLSLGCGPCCVWAASHAECNITENPSDIFIEAFSSTHFLFHAPLSRFSVNDLVYHLNSRIAKVIDATAPTKVKVVSGKKQSPWRNATLVKMEKKECQKAERRCWKNNLQVHFDISKERLYIFNLESKKILLRHYHQE